MSQLLQLCQVSLLVQSLAGVDRQVLRRNIPRNHYTEAEHEEILLAFFWLAIFSSGVFWDYLFAGWGESIALALHICAEFWLSRMGHGMVWHGTGWITEKERQN